MKAIIKRTCANCSAFVFSPVEKEPACVNLMYTVTPHVNEEGEPIMILGEPYPMFCCEDHQTDAKEKAQEVAVEKFFTRLGVWK